MSLELAKTLKTLLSSEEARLNHIDRYARGKFDPPYSPGDERSNEHKMMVERSMASWCTLPVDAAVQALAVDAYRAGARASGHTQGSLSDQLLPEWGIWQRSNLDAKQTQIYRTAFTFGQAFAVTFLDRDGRAQVKGMSPMNTVAWFEDPGWDDNAVAVLHKGPQKYDKDGNPAGHVWDMWDREYKWTLEDRDGDYRVVSREAHACPGHCPVTRFPVSLDDQGRVRGFIEPIIPLQDRMSQTTFDLLVAQTYTSHQVLTITGMVPEPLLDNEGKPLVDEQGQPIMRKLQRNAARVFAAESPDTKFDVLPAGSLNGFIDSLDMSIKHFSSLTQTPPHFLLGQIANLSAEALQAAEQSFARKISEHQRVFGEAWERVLRLGVVMENGHEDENDETSEHGEVVWRDFGAKQLGAVADGLGKLATQLQIPARGLWPRVPGVTQGELNEWLQMHDEDQEGQRLADYLDSWPQEQDQEAQALPDTRQESAGGDA